MVHRVCYFSYEKVCKRGNQPDCYFNFLSEKNWVLNHHPVN